MMQRGTAIIGVSTLGLALLLNAGCGDESRKIDGPFVEVIGSQYKLFPISENDLSVVCKPKPGLGEFEFEAATSSGKELGKFLKFTIKEYTKPKTYDFYYAPTSLGFELKVGFEDPEATAGTDKGYSYEFMQHLRPDINKTYPSKCTIRMSDEELTNGTKYTGTIDCVMLWSTFNSKDYTTGNLNAFVDLFASFTCIS